MIRIRCAAPIPANPDKPILLQRTNHLLGQSADVIYTGQQAWMTMDEIIKVILKTAHKVTSYFNKLGDADTSRLLYHTVFLLTTIA